MLPTLAQVSSLNSSFEADLEDYSAGHCRSVELWFGKLETYLDSHSPADVRALLERHELHAPAASFQGGLLTSQAEARREHWASFERRLALCRELGVSVIVVAGDVAGPLTQPDFERLQFSLQEIAKLAGQYGVLAALEFQGRAAFPNNLQSAAALVADVGSPHLGLCLDAFHYYIGPSKPEDLGYLTPDNLFHVQLCDLAGQARELVTDGDRILPGDGDFQLAPIVDHLQAIGYQRAVSIELLNPSLWQVPARQFGEIAITSLRKLLGQASMG